MALSALLASSVVAYSLDDLYTATALVMVKPREKLRLEPNRTDKETGDYPVSQLAPIDAPSRTYIEMIKSRLLAERVVKALRLDEKREEPARSPFKAFLHRAKRRLATLAGRAWDVLRYGSVQRPDALSKAVREVRNRCRLATTKDTYLFNITCQASHPEMAAAIANSSAEIFIEYTAAVNQRESGNARAFLEEQLRESERFLAKRRSALTAFKDQEATFLLQEEYANQLQTISGLEADLQKTEARLAGLLNEFTPDHPKVQSLLAEKDRLQQSLATLRAQRATLPEKERQLEDLRLRVKAAEENYTVVTKALAETRIQEQSQVSDIRIVSPAVTPASPSKPLRIYYVLGALGASLVIGVFSVFLHESMWPRTRSKADVERVGLTVLATISKIK